MIPKSAKDIESVAWHPTLEHNFCVSTESGQVFGFDSRKIVDPVFVVQAHKKACSNVVFSPHIPNMMCTSGTDGICKVWDIAANGGQNPEEICFRNMKQGELFTMQFCQDIPWVLATGGSNGEMAIWDTSENEKTENHFKKNLIEGSYNKDHYDENAERVVGSHQKGGDDGFEDMQDDDESDDEVQISSSVKGKQAFPGPAPEKKDKKDKKKKSKK